MNSPTPPHDLDAEAAVLSAVMLEKAALDRVRDIISPEHFYSDANGRIYAAALQLSAVGTPIDVVSVASWLRGRDLLGLVGGASYLALISDATPSVANVEAHARTVRSKHRRREIIATAQRIAAEGYGDVGDEAAWVDSIESRIHYLATDRAVDDATSTLKSVLVSVFRELANPNRDPGVQTGLQDLDKWMGPMRAGHLIIIAAASGIGKSALAMTMALHPAMHPVMLPGAEGKGQLRKVTQGVLVFALEMPEEELATRVLFGEARVNSRKASDPVRIKDSEWTAIAAAGESMSLPNVYFDDRSGLTTTQIRARARRVKAEAKRDGFELRLIVIDYLQLLGSDVRAERREREVAMMSKALKDLARELELPIVVLAQLNDDARQEKRKPCKEDLRESKAVGNDADKIILIHNEAATARRRAARSPDAEEGACAPEVVELLIDKNRGGDEGFVLARFWPAFAMFGDAEREDYERHAALAEAPR